MHVDSIYIVTLRNFFSYIMTTRLNRGGKPGELQMYISLTDVSSWPWVDVWKLLQFGWVLGCECTPVVLGIVVRIQ